jgi:8-oxo-dGTP diphosphatase
MKVIDVTCAIIWFGQRILVVQRSETMKLPLKWEFPGGKIENGENEEESIKREIREELNIEIEIFSRLTPSLFQYSDFKIYLIPFVAKYVSGEIILTEHKQYQLLDKSELKELDWADADIAILNEFLVI